MKKESHDQPFAYMFPANNVFTIKKWWDSNQLFGSDPQIRDFGYVIPFTATVEFNITFK